MKRMIKLAGIIILTAGLFPGCSKKSGTATGGMITVKGSDTMVHLASNWSEAYMRVHPEVGISVTGGGSGTGLAALINGTTDICLASRSIKTGELEAARKRGIVPVETPVALDGIAVVVHPDNPVQDLTVEQIGNLYTGMYTNWKQVGGPDHPVVVLARESSSGTFVFFQEQIMNRQDYSQSALLMPSTAAIIQSVSQDQWAIGYVGLGYAREASQRVKILGIRKQTESAAEFPDLASIRTGQYPIARALFFYTNAQPSGPVKEFLDYCLSADGQQIVLQAGYVPLKGE